MTREEIVRLSAEKALRELSWESIKYLFRPINGVELLLRIDFEGMEQKIYDWIGDNSPDAMPHRFRPPYISQLLGAIKLEKFYREISAQRAACQANTSEALQAKDTEGSARKNRGDICD